MITLRIEEKSPYGIRNAAASRFPGDERLVSQGLKVALKVPQLSRFAAAFDSFESYKKRHKTATWIEINSNAAKTQKESSYYNDLW